jgi:hypothetical protein
MKEASEVGYSTLPGMVFVAITIILMLVVHRKYAWLPLVMAGCWMTLGQNILLGGINLPVLRLVLAAAMVRVIIRGEFRGINFLTIDRVFILWLITAITAYVALWQTSESLINRLGLAYNAIGMYFCLRAWIIDREDVDRLTRLFAFVLLPIAISMSIEKLTGRNLFSIFGGVPLHTVVRDNKLRCQGPFAHPILAGTVGAVWFPVFLNMVLQQRERILGMLGAGACALIVVTSRSSGPLLTLIIALFGMSLWPLRGHMRTLRWGFLAFIIFLQVAMKSPIWFLIGRVNVVSGSTGWHRAHLIDMSVQHFTQWLLVGVKDSDIVKWGVHAGDITNHYLFEGLRGGVVTLILFLVIMTLAFSYVGRAVKWQRQEPADTQYYHSMWSLGVMAAAHAATFISVAYFNPQIMLHWYLTLAVIVAMYQCGPNVNTYDEDEEHSTVPATARHVWWAQVRRPPALAANTTRISHGATGALEI